MLYIIQKNKVLMFEDEILGRTGDIIDISEISKDKTPTGTYLLTNLITGFTCQLQSKAGTEKITADCKSLSYNDYAKRLISIETLKKIIIEAIKKAQDEKKAQEEATAETVEDVSEATTEATTETTAETVAMEAAKPTTKPTIKKPTVKVAPKVPLKKTGPVVKKK